MADSEEEKIVEVTLKSYVNFLSRVSRGKLNKTAFLNGTEAKISKELEEEGLISPGVFRFSGGGPGFANTVIITPSGAQALVEWKNVLQKNSWWHPLLTGFSRLFWIAIGWVSGVAAPSFSRLIKPYIDKIIEQVT